MTRGQRACIRIAFPPGYAARPRPRRRLSPPAGRPSAVRLAAYAPCSRRPAPRRCDTCGATCPGDDAVAVARPAIATPGRPLDRLELDAGHLTWLADARGLERRAPDRRLRHYTLRLAAAARRPAAADRPAQAAAEGDPALDPARDHRRIPAHDAAHGFARGRSVRAHAARHVGRATGPAGRSRGLLRLRPGCARVRHLPHRGLSRGGRAHADRPVRHRRPARRVGGGAAARGPAADRPPPPARAAAGDAAPAAGRTDVAGAGVAGGHGTGPAARRARAGARRGATRATPTTSRSPAARTCRSAPCAGWWARSCATRASAWPGTRRACGGATSARWSAASSSTTGST